ncbi:hypothetical protein F5148DRAFT_816527 [Russula earlei]|uniref:Uncharacterized protein n=1 Tax=Russula earlei TaxID=71964 RepID=A0ACC0UBF9_9AGAM|nr:hypothetical protein F5148DRAFT_816527 [Russula earlei]
MSTSEAFPFTQTNDEISGANLFAIAPSTIRDARYQGDFRVKVSPTVISQGAHFKSAPSYQSQGWTLAVHPEGKRYAYILTEQRVSVVTESQVTDTGVAERIEGWIALIHARATEEDVHLLETSDLFLELEPDSNACNYWFADHALRTIFWLRSADSREIGLPNSCSDGHLQYSLEENYWIHVEMFPGTAAQYATTALNELQIILLHARADALTSDVPTFPYTAEESEKFINLLQCSKDHATNPYITTVVARLWVVVANHRFFTHFGENHCRMSAVHSVLEAPIRKRSLLLTGISKVLFDLPNEHRRRLENIWVDELVYAAAWRKYVSERVEDLRLTMIWVSQTRVIGPKNICSFIVSSQKSFSR